MHLAVSSSLSDNKLFFGPKHNIYTFFMILFGLFDLILLLVCQIYLKNLLKAYEETSSEDPAASSAADPYYNPYDPYNQQTVQSADPYQSYPASGRKIDGILNFKRIGNAVENLWSKATNAINR